MKEKLNAFMENSIVGAVMMITTVYALIGTDLVAWFRIPKSYDSIVHMVSFVALILFILEFVINTYAKEGYPFGFFFWLDFVAAISLVPDVPFIMDPILIAMGLGGGASGGGLAIARAGRAARAGARAGRIARVFKLLSKLNLVGNKEEEPEEDKEDDLGELEPSAVGGVFSDLMTQKAILGVMAMLISVAMLDYDAVHPFDRVSLEQIEAQSGAIQKRMAEEYVEKSNKDDRHPDIVYLYVKGKEVYRNAELIQHPIDDKGTVFFNKHQEATLRKSEVLRVLTDNNSHAWFDVRSDQAQKGQNGFFMTLFVVFLLGLGTMLFQSDAQQLFIGPIEQMMKTVRALSENPLMSLSTSGGDDGNETKAVQSAIAKIGGLLQIGFGEAGAEIIAHNLSTGGGELNAMVPGAKIEAIYGFCDIRNFTDATECFQEDVMLFVNSIADIVHMTVNETGGAPNKNIGDAFLLIWRMRDQDKQVLADGALDSYVETIKRVEESEILRELTQRPVMQERIPGFSVKMGYGFHCGWAIEGAIGSQLKVDASYLSPNVNLSARFESATKQYGVDVLFSGEFQSMLSPEKKRKCRQIDHLTMKGSEQPVKLYTYDHEEHTEFEMSEYYETFDHAMQCYMGGDWKEAKENFEACSDAWPEDVPPTVIVDYMKDFDFVAPADWKGYRKLTSK